MTQRISGPNDPVRDYLRKSGAPHSVVTRGLRGLVENWERVVQQVLEGYPLTLDDYLNDMDGRQLLANALELAPAEVRDAFLPRVAEAGQHGGGEARQLGHAIAAAPGREARQEALGARLGERNGAVLPGDGGDEEVVTAHAEPVAIGEECRGGHHGVVQDGAVAAAVHEDRAFRCGQDAGVAPGDLEALEREVAALEAAQGDGAAEGEGEVAGDEVEGDRHAAVRARRGLP